MHKILSRSKPSLVSRPIGSSYTFFNRFSSVHKPRGEDKIPYSFKAGDSVHGFNVTRTEEIPLYSMKAFVLEHNNTKAKYLHLHTLDANNCFAVGFKTTPKDDKGASHILEKLVLCGSEKYPVRDPFANMVSRSLNTYMNVWTGTDYTCFPFSSYNEKDFKNLMSVYLESVFRPLLTHHDFMQEGWHYTFQKEDNPDSDLVATGVVYNQMKAIFQSADNIFLETLQKNLFIDTPYKFCAGGVPQHILSLSYEELKEIHKRLYHPSNSFFYSYGDLDFTEHLQFINQNYLSNYQAINPDTDIPLQKRFNFPEEIKIKCPPDPTAVDPENQAQYGVSYLCSDIKEDPLTSAALNILSYMLFETPNSPFFEALFESGLTSGYCAGYGYDMNTREGSFTIGAKNLSSDYGEMMKIDKVIDDTLKLIVEKGFPEDFLESVLHQIEFQSKLPKPDSGILLLQSLVPQLNHGGDPLALLKINEVMGEIKKRMRKSKYFEGIIKKHFIDNKHKIRLVMTPDKNYIAEETNKEKRALKDTHKKLNPRQRHEIVKDNVNLRQKQGEIQDINILPNLEVEDIPIKGPKTEFEVNEVMGIPFYFTQQPTNGITSFRIRLDIKDLPENLRPYIKLFCQIFPRLGTKTVKSEEFIQMLDLHSYNFEVQHISSSSPNDVNKCEEYLLLSITCLDRNIENMFNHLTELLTSPDLKDLTNISQLLKIFSSEASNSLVEDSVSHALNYAEGGLRKSSKQTDKLRNARFLCDLATECLKASQIKGILTDISKRLERIFIYLFTQKNMAFCVNGSKDMYEQLHRRIELLCHTLKTERGEMFTNAESKDSEAVKDASTANEEIIYKTFFPLPMQSNYIVETFPIPHFTHQDTPKLHVLSEVLSGFYQEEVKEKGGAYGAGTHISQNGTLSCYSYRDPHLLKTYQSFEKGIQWAAEGGFSIQSIKEAKLRIFAKIDQVESPLSKGLKLFVNGVTDEMRDEYRKRLLDTSKDEIVDVANRYLLEVIKEGKSSQVIFGTQTNDLEGLMSRGWKIERPIEGLSVKEESYEQNVSSVPRITHGSLLE